MKACNLCPQPAEAPDYTLCAPCAIELAYRMMASEPEPGARACRVCGAEFSFTDARVIRSAKNPSAGSRQTPELCWVCVRLHVSARNKEELKVPF